MTAAKCVFERREIKYRLSPEQYAVVLPEICRRLSADEYGETFQSTDEFIRTLEEYLWYYNNERISLKLKGMSPVQYRTHSLI